MDFESLRPEENLDPQDWDQLRSLGHQMVDDMLAYLQNVRERPVWQPMGDDIRERFDEPLPLYPHAPAEVYQQFKESILPHPMGNIHPRFWGWVMGNGTALGALAEFLAAGMNPNMGGADHGGVLVETQVINWLKEMFGFPAASSGLLVSGGSVANLIGLAAARYHRAGIDVRQDGLQSIQQPLVVYGSTETHSSVQKAVELLGIGSRYYRQIPVDERFRIRLDTLVEAIEADRAAGLLPICVVGTAGTTNTGSIDDLNALAEICRTEDLWFHVDGAIGAMLRLAPSIAEFVQGMELADSLAFDLHKWMHVNFEAGGVLIKDEETHRRAFSLTPDYLVHAERGLAAGKSWFSDYGIQLTRGFRALKVWMSLKEHGVEKFGRLVEQNCTQARYLAERIQYTPELEIMAPVPISIVCFRYRVPGMDMEALNALNKELLLRLQESGIALPSHTMIAGHYALRVAVFNHRTCQEDMDILVDAVLRIGRELVQSR